MSAPRVVFVTSPSRNVNYPWVSMLIVGGVLAVGGFIWAIVGNVAARDIDILTRPEAWATAQQDLYFGYGLASFGILLLVVAWAVAAIRWPTVEAVES